MRNTKHEVLKGHHRVESISLICQRKTEFRRRELEVAEVRGVAESLAPQGRVVAQEVEVPEV